MDSKIPEAVCFAVFAFLTTLTNLIVIVTILRTTELRNSSKYLLVLVLCTCNLFTGLFYYPINADILFRQNLLDYNCHTRNAVYIYVPYILTTLRLSLMIALFIEFVLSLFIKDAKLLFKISLSMVVCAFTTSFVLVFPIVESKLEGCDFYDLDYNSLNVATFFPQMVVLVFLGVTIGVVYVKHHHEFPLYDPQTAPGLPRDTFLACIVMVLFGFPFHVFLVTPMKCSYNSNDCAIDMVALHYCLQFFFCAQTFVVPLTWCTNFQFRKHMFACHCTSNGHSSLENGAEMNHVRNEYTENAISK